MSTRSAAAIFLNVSIVPSRLPVSSCEMYGAARLTASANSFGHAAIFASYAKFVFAVDEPIRDCRRDQFLFASREVALDLVNIARGDRVLGVAHTLPTLRCGGLGKP